MSNPKKYDPFSSDTSTDLEENKPEALIITARGGSTKYSVATIQKAIQDGCDFEIIPSGSSAILVPSGSKGIIVRTEFNPEAQNQINQLVDELSKVEHIASQEDVAFANKILAKAKKTIKFLGAERLMMSSVLKAESDNLIDYERKIVADLQNTCDVVTENVLKYQQKVFEENKRIEAEIQKQKDIELAKIQAESNRKNEINTLILDFERGILSAIQSATIGDIDQKIAKLQSYVMTADDYMEFLPQAQIKYQECVTKMNSRKTELLQLQQAEKTNKAEADRIKAIQEAQAQADNEAMANRAAMSQEALVDERDQEISNTQMTAELKSSMSATPKGVAILWVFDEETINMSLLPDEYKTFDKDKIKKAIGAGCRSIPGVNIHEKLSNRPR